AITAPRSSRATFWYWFETAEVSAMACPGDRDNGKDPSLFSRRLKRLFCFMPQPLVCATVTARRMSDLRRGRDAVADADLIELRLDMVSDPDVAGALAGRRLPVVVTCRPQWEGGAFDGSEEERKRMLGRAAALGAEFIDVEWRAAFHDLVAARPGRRIVLSAHAFDGL